MLLRAVPDRALDDLLASVSRSFYLSLAILPRAMRTQVSAAYLAARAADTIADTQVVRAERRLEVLEQLRAAVGEAAKPVAIRQELVGAATPGERRLLERLPECLHALADLEPGDRERTRKVLDTLSSGMER